ncbi:MAG: YajQ family cyclic di-GMP-binding protein [Acidobacteria bacterium]|nr:MAG: YajQ family cyclic di-GMP-binding protein [Acidobacteriota bacterium]
MAQENSFDIVCKVDLQEVDNAIQQVTKEIRTRYDFKGSKSDVRREDFEIHLLADDDYKRRSLMEMLNQRLAARKVSLKCLTLGKPEEAAGGALRQTITLQQGIPTEQAREIVKIIKGTGKKVQAAIQGDLVRVRGKSRNDLQSIMQILRSSSLSVEMQFENYR